MTYIEQVEGVRRRIRGLTDLVKQVDPQYAAQEGKATYEYTGALLQEAVGQLSGVTSEGDATDIETLQYMALMLDEAEGQMRKLIDKEG